MKYLIPMLAFVASCSHADKHFEKTPEEKEVKRSPFNLVRMICQEKDGARVNCKEVMYEVQSMERCLEITKKTGDDFTFCRFDDPEENTRMMNWFEEAIKEMENKDKSKGA